MKTATQPPDRIFRALSDPTRLRILHMLLRGELCVCDIVSVLGCPQPTASRHLAYLRKVGLVEARKDGVWNYYRLAPVATEFDDALRKCVESCGQLSQLTKDSRRLEKARAACCE